MALLTNALDTPFTPLVGEFIVQVTGRAPANLLRKNNSVVADWAVLAVIPPGSALVVRNPVAGAVYKFTDNGGANAPTVRADENAGV